MQRGQPLRLEAVLPNGIGVDDFYMVLAAAAAFFVVWSLGNSFFERDKLAPRLRTIQERREEMRQDFIGRRKHKREPKKKDWMRVIVGRAKLFKDHQIDHINLRLIQAGFRSKDAIVVYSFSKLVSPFIGLAMGIFVADINWSDPFAEEETWKLLFVIGAAYLGARMPDLLIMNRRQKRYLCIQRALADSLDLMLICAEAGLSLVAALDRVARELGQAYPEMAEELGLTSVEIGFLPDRNTALKHLAERVDIQEVRSIVNVLQQTEKYGTPVAQALRVLSKEFRTARMLRAEQKAARLPALLTIPMILFILPTLFVIILTPAMIGVADSF